MKIVKQTRGRSTRAQATRAASKMRRYQRNPQKDIESKHSIPCPDWVHTMLVDGKLKLISDHREGTKLDDEGMCPNKCDRGQIAQPSTFHKEGRTAPKSAA